MPKKSPRFTSDFDQADALGRRGAEARSAHQCRHAHEDAVARAFGAEGIGLCRTEHMFFGEDRIAAVRQMILADDDKPSAREALALLLLPMQRKDFVGIFKAMDGLPVTIRLLDPPLHEFLPTEDPSSSAPLAQGDGLSPSRSPGEGRERLHERTR